MARLLPLASLVTLLTLWPRPGLAADPGHARADWPQFRGSHRNNISPDKGLLKEWPREGPAEVWKATGVGKGFSSVSVAGDKVFTMGDQGDSGFVFALDRDTGRKVWAARVGRSGGNFEGTRCTPTVDGDRVYAIGQFGDLVCLDTGTGTVRWHMSFPRDFKGRSGGWNYTESPLVDGGRLVCTPGGPVATLVALDKRTGQVLWKSALGDAAGYASPVISEAGGIRQYVQLLSGGLVGVSARDGKLLWRYRRLANTTANIPTPVVLGEQVFCTAGYDKGGALLTLTRSGAGIRVKEEYFNPELKNKHGGVVVVGDHVYGDRDDSGRPWCAEWRTGKVVWRKDRRTRGQGSAALTYADGHLYVRYGNGYVALVPATAEGYRETGTFKIPGSSSVSWPHPVVIGGRLYLREQDVVWCYDVKAR